MTGVVPALALAVLLSTHAPGAPAHISLRATFELQCGWPGPKIAAVFPAAERLAGPITVTIDGKRPAAVSRAGRTVTLTVARPNGVMCDSIGPGTVRIAFTSGIRNPAKPGSYRIALRHNSESATGAFDIR